MLDIWEYQSVTRKYDNTRQMIDRQEAELNKFGEDGWELVQALNLTKPPDAGPPHMCYVFKRKKQR